MTNDHWPLTIDLGAGGSREGSPNDEVRMTNEGGGSANDEGMPPLVGLPGLSHWALIIGPWSFVDRPWSLRLRSSFAGGLREKSGLCGEFLRILRR